MPIEFKVLERRDPTCQACRTVVSRDRGTASFLRSALRGSVWVEALLQEARLHGSSAALPDFIPWEPGTSYQFCRTEVKKDGGKCEGRLAQNGFCSSKKSHK